MGNGMKQGNEYGMVLYISMGNFVHTVQTVTCKQLSTVLVKVTGTNSFVSSKIRQAAAINMYCEL